MSQNAGGQRQVGKKKAERTRKTSKKKSQEKPRTVKKSQESRKDLKETEKPFPAWSSVTVGGCPCQVVVVRDRWWSSVTGGGRP